MFLGAQSALLGTLIIINYSLIVFINYSLIVFINYFINCFNLKSK